MDEQGSEQTRSALPARQFTNEFSLWSVLRSSIGKDLSKVTMPVVFNEPLSFLQRLAENMEYSELLAAAALEEDPKDRLKKVAAFAVSGLACNWERLGKPFNPLLGETYELVRPGFNLIAEQVSHHPPVSAFHASGENFVFHGAVQPRLKLTGKSVEIQPKGLLTVELTKWQEAYTWRNVACCVHNVIVGRLWIEQHGTMEIHNHKTGDRAILNFKPAEGSGASKMLHRVEGFIVDKAQRRSHYLYGKWIKNLCCTEIVNYEIHAAKNSKRDGNKSPSDSPHTPKKVLAKLNSLKVSTFRSSISSDTSPSGGDEASGGADEVDGPPDDVNADSDEIPGSETLWQATARPVNSPEYYQFTTFAMGLNEITPAMRQIICPTDSRIRPDIRRLENGDVDGAANEKTRLEEKQRRRRKAEKNSGGGVGARWFAREMNPHCNEEDWIYLGRYFDRDFSKIDEIF